MADGSDPRTQPSFLRTALWLAAFVLLAFALRSVFTIPVAYDAETGRNLFTGNDPYYHWRTASHVLETGSNLDSDTAINYPEGRDNPNPPLWTWTSALVAGVFKAMGIGGADPVGNALNIMVAFWGALCVIPIYMIGRDLWGRRAGLWAALFMSFSAPHIQRSIWGYADHDAISMFFILLALAFIVRALKVMDSREHVAHWNKAAAIGTGMRDAVRRNQDTLLYATLAGISVTACAITWKGYPYVFGIIGLAAFFQLVLDHLRNRDSTVTWLVYTVVIAVGTLLPWLIYYQFQPNQLASTVFPSLYVLYGVLLLGLVLVPTRDLPSILVFPAMAVGAILAVLYLMWMQPGIWNAITSGLGYFQQSKLYSTIAEAQRPQLGEVAATLGFFTFLLAFWGFFRTVRFGLRGDGANILVASWAIVAMYMMFRASRFEVNAAPLFCVLLGFTMDRIVALMGADEVRKRFRSQHGQNPIARSFRSLSWKPVVFALAIAFFLVLPNAWLGWDASMPFEYKTQHLPGFMDASRDPKTGAFLHGAPRLGAFGISFEDIAGSEDWIGVMNGLAKRDTCKSDVTKVCLPSDADYKPLEQRPAFIGWWDYGHWAVSVGMHPTVADPFQSHYDLSGRFLASDSEEEGMSWLTILLVRGDRIANHGQFSQPMADLLQRTNANLTAMTGDFAHDYTLLQANHVDIFTLYDDVSAVTDKTVGYMGVSSRMYPVGGAGIFYAPVFLADKNPDDYIETRLQATFPDPALGTKYLQVHQYEMVANHSVRLEKIKFTDDQGKNYTEYQGYLYAEGQTPLQGYAATSGAPYDPARAQQSQPTQKFYGSLFARAFGNTILAGQKNSQGQEVGQPSGDGLTHWRTIRETSENQTLNDEAHSPVKSRGVVLLAYYRGVNATGSLVDEAGAPLPGYSVVFRDGSGAQHGRSVTDAQGHFTLNAPFSQDNDLKLQVLGTAGNVVFTDSSANLQFTRDQAQSRAQVTLAPITVPHGGLSGLVYEEKNGNTTYEAGVDSPLSGATVALSGGHPATTGADGRFSLETLPAGDYSVVASKWPAFTNSTAKTVTVTAGGHAETQIGLTLRPTKVLATFLDTAGQPVAGVPLQFTSATGAPQSPQTNATGVAAASLTPGSWAITVDYNVTTADANETATTTHYVAHGTVDIQPGDGDKAVTLRQE